MFRGKVKLLEWWLTIIYFLVPAAAFSVAVYLRFVSGFFPQVDFDVYPYFLATISTTILWAVVLEHYQLNRVEEICSKRIALGKNVSATIFTMGLVLAATFFYRETSFSRIFIAAAGTLVFILSVAVKLTFRALVFRKGFLRSEPWRVAVLGADENAARLAEQVLKNSFIHCDIAAFVLPPGQSGSSVSGPVLEWSRLEEVVNTFHCQELLITLPVGHFRDNEELFGRVRSLPIPSRLVMDLGAGILAPGRLFDFFGISLLDVKPYPVETIGYVVTKRAFDIVFSIMALTVTAPVFLIVALAIKLTSHGPVFFTQERVGFNGKRFRMIKFRSMVLQEGRSSDSQHTSRSDPRITRVGQFLRKTSLDELPQFVNVLRGDMSVVGPRPELTHFVQKFRGEIPAYMARHNVKCGITGWAQVNGLRGSDTSIPRRIEYDLHYIQNWSLRLDIEIIVLTLMRGLMSRHAY